MESNHDFFRGSFRALLREVEEAVLMMMVIFVVIYLKL